MKIIVLTVVSVAMFTVNCRDISGDGEPEDTVITIGPDPLDEDQLKDGTVQNERKSEEVNVPHEVEMDAEELRVMAVNISSAGSNLYTEMNQNKLMNTLISNLTVANTKMLDFMTASITNLTIAIAELKSEQQFTKENVTNALTQQDIELDSIRKHQGCPKGMFYYGPTAQCFLLINDTSYNWQNADKACRAKGLVLAHPYEPLGIRNYIVTKYGDGNYVWIGGKSTGSCVKFQDSNRCIGSSNPLWYYRHTSTSYCLGLIAYSSNWASKPTKAYYSLTCGSTYWTLCEKVHE